MKKNNFFVYKIKKINYMSGSLRVFASKLKKKNQFYSPRKVSLNEFKIFKKGAFNNSKS